MENPAGNGRTGNKGHEGGWRQTQRGSNSYTTERAVSAGGVVYRIIDGKIETVLCGRNVPARWALAKGTPDKGESLEETALREVNEETGLEVSIEAPIGSVNYWFSVRAERVRYDKTVHFYLMSYQGGSTDRHDPEFDEVRWFSCEEAARRLTFANEARILEKAISMIKTITSGHGIQTEGTMRGSVGV